MNQKELQVQIQLVRMLHKRKDPEGVKLYKEAAARLK